jgi:CxxC motif-containing protein (DUF1111 family)
MKGFRPVAWGFAVAAGCFVVTFSSAVQGQQATLTEAPTGFALRSNGFAQEFCGNQTFYADTSDRSPQIPDEECNFDTALEEFTGPEDPTVGLGSIFNSDGCGSCHTTPILGGSSQITEKRAGFFTNGVFTDPPGGSLIQDQALKPDDIEHVPENANVFALRSSLSILGDGFVEALGTTFLENLAASQPSAVRGLLIRVPVAEGNGETRPGRFGHKDQQASLLSFSADAYVNEMGITSPFEPTENTSMGRVVADEGAPDTPDNSGVDVALFALFMRSTLAPPRGPISGDANTGNNLFNNIGCANCHRQTLNTQPVNQDINAQAFKLPPALANKTFHPFSDFLLHDVGTGDGIVQNGGQGTRNMLRTPALWGLRTRNRFMHDELSLTLTDAIRRHAGQASAARNSFNALNSGDRNRVIQFLMSL